MSDNYNYAKETLTAEAIQSKINQLAKVIDDFSYEIETEDVNTLQRQIKAMQKTASRIVTHLSSLNTKEDLDAYVAEVDQKERAEKVAKLLTHANFLEYVSMDQANITDEDIVAFQEYYNVRLSPSGYGTWRWLDIYDTKGNKLDSEDLVRLHIRKEAPSKIADVPAVAEEPDQKEDHPYNSFGYVLPDGTFYPSPFGTHEEAAIELVKEHGWKNEKLHSSYTLCRDFLIYEKGYVLIHNPLFDGGYVVSRSADKTLTKAQRETLYDYFMENGDTFLANKYFNEDYNDTFD